MPTPAVPAQPPQPAPSSVATGGDSAAAPPVKANPWAIPDGPRDDDPIPPPPPALTLDAWEKAIAVKGLAAAPATCAAFARRAAAKPAPADIAIALAEKDAGKRDAMLVALEGKGEATLRALRADLAPIECADAIVDPYLSAKKGGGSPHLHVLVGLSLAGKLSRTAQSPPVMGPIRDKEKVKAFVAGPLKTWLLDQSRAIETLAAGAAGLSGYGRGIAAIESGIAELRLVDKMRSAPVPTGWDAELKAVYETVLDEALEPRKQRGRDAALVGMSDLAQAGVLRDPRVDRARALLAKLYGGRRIDALDALMLPAPAAAPALPASIYWHDTIGGKSDDKEVLARGVPPTMRAQFRAASSPGKVVLVTTYARARLDLGRVYWRRMDFVEAAHAASVGNKPEDRLVLAVALALAHAPNGASEMMRAASPAALELAHTDALDALAAESSPVAGMAAFDAAHLRSLSPPDGDAAVAHLRDVAERFKKAEGLLTDPALKKRAADRAVEAESLAASAEKKPKS
ncbi:MAG: hypothetical protein KF819_17630 [Labilithrix sp.]|nr:hypothetical protein [Labilithrix sp.]